MRLNRVEETRSQTRYGAGTLGEVAALAHRLVAMRWPVACVYCCRRAIVVRVIVERPKSPWTW